jgi:hypothetical protein
MKPIILIAGAVGAIGIGWYLYTSSDISIPAPTETPDSDALAQQLADALPNAHSQYASAYAIAAVQNPTKYLDVQSFGLLMAGVVDRESKAGAFLKPRGPGGVGDPTSRWMDPDNLPGYVTDDMKSGNVRDDGKMEILAPAIPATQVRGWGFGLGQIDYASFKDWLANNDWTDPATNLTQCGAILANAIDQFGDVELGVCAYNAGVSRIKKANGDHDAANAKTTGGDYGSDVLSRAEGFGFTVSGKQS